MGPPSEVSGRGEEREGQEHECDATGARQGRATRGGLGEHLRGDDVCALRGGERRSVLHRGAGRGTVGGGGGGRAAPRGGGLVSRGGRGFRAGPPPPPPRRGFFPGGGTPPRMPGARFR